MDVEEILFKLFVVVDKGELNDKDDEREEKVDLWKKEIGK